MYLVLRFTLMKRCGADFSERLLTWTFCSSRKMRDTQTVIDADSLEEFLNYSVAKRQLRESVSTTSIVAFIAACKKRAYSVLRVVRGMTWRSALMGICTCCYLRSDSGRFGALQRLSSIRGLSGKQEHRPTRQLSFPRMRADSVAVVGKLERAGLGANQGASECWAFLCSGRKLPLCDARSDKAFWRYDTVNNLWENLSLSLFRLSRVRAPVMSPRPEISI